jgi:hypothetical protein
MTRSTDARCIPLAAVLCSLVACGCDSSTPEARGAHIEVLAAPLSGSSSPPIRQISVRSPYGDVAATGNLALDGDFELEQGASSSAWWLLDATGAYGTLAFDTGGRCRSGLYCADVPAGFDLYDFYVGIRPGSAGTLTFAAKPAGRCSDIHGEIDLGVDAEGLVFDAFVTQPVSASPGPDGWCTYKAHYAADRPLYQWTQVELYSASETLFDDVVVEESEESRTQAESEKRAGAPDKGRALVMRRRAAWEAGQRRAATMGDPRGARRAARAMPR